MREETINTTALREQIEALRHMTVGQLKYKYREVFGEEGRSNHKQFLFRRVAWRIQANAEGGLSKRARRRALEIANDADLRIRAPKNFLKEPLDETRTVEPLLTISQWADRYRTLSQRASAEPGPWRTDRTPYLRDIMDCLSPSSVIERVVFMKGAQIGGPRPATTGSATSCIRHPAR